MSATVIPMHLAHETGEDLLEELSPQEKEVKVLEQHFPRLVNDCVMLVQRPVRFHWDPMVGTAATDCLAEIWMSPHFFLEGLVDIGYGTAYHECGHILSSPYGVELMKDAESIGGPTLRYLVNIVLDRKDDILSATHAPGFAETLRNRLAYICTMTRRDAVKAHIEKSEMERKQREREPKPELVKLRKRFKRKEEKRFNPLEKENFERILKNVKPNNPYEDFFFAAKWHKRPRTKAATKAMKYLGAKCLLKASPAEILWICQKIREILGEPSEVDQKQAEKQFIELCLIAAVFAGKAVGPGKSGGKLDKKVEQALKRMIKQYVATVRTGGLERLLGRLKVMSMIHPGSISAGLKREVPIKEVKADQRYAAAYQDYLAEVQSMVDPLVRALRHLDNPSEFMIYGQEEGDLDLTESARIATGLSGYHQETVTERDIDAEIHLAIDCSGSMIGDKVEQAKQIATVFTEAMLALGDDVKGRLWAFSSEAIYDYGSVARNSGFVTADGEAGNSDTHMLTHVGAKLAKSRKRRRVLLVLGDDGPDDLRMASEMSQQLLARGIVVVHLLVGVHGTPDIYPFELIYTSMQECLDQFGNLLETIIKHLK